MPKTDGNAVMYASWMDKPRPLGSLYCRFETSLLSLCMIRKPEEPADMLYLGTQAAQLQIKVHRGGLGLAVIGFSKCKEGGRA